MVGWLYCSVCRRKRHATIGVKTCNIDCGMHQHGCHKANVDRDLPKHDTDGKNLDRLKQDTLVQLLGTSGLNVDEQEHYPT